MICEGDCDDSGTDTYPGATDPCDGIDQDCDTFDDCYEDLDEDSFGSTTAAIAAVSSPLSRKALI